MSPWAAEGQTGDLRTQNTFESRLILDDECRTFYLQELFSLEIGEQARHCFSGSADHLGDLFVCKGKRELYLAFSFVMICGEIQQEAGQLLSCGMREANRSHFRDGRMVGFTELLCHAQCCFAVLAQKEQEIGPRDEIGLRRLDYVCRELIRFPCDRRGQTQDLSLFRDPKNETFPIGRRGRQFDLATA